MVRYHESLQINAESDEFSLGTEDDNEKEQDLDESIESVKNHEMEEEMQQVNVCTSERMEGTSKRDEETECPKNVEDQHG